MRRLAYFALLAMCLALPARTDAASIVVTLGDYNGPPQAMGSPPVDLGVIGTFAYAIPGGAVITSATFSGTYGTQAVPGSTAGFNVRIEGETIIVCVVEALNCWYGGADFRPFSFDLQQFAIAGLLDGSADLRVIQTSEVEVRLGTPTLTIHYQAVPEPASLVLFGLAVSGFAVRRHTSG